MRKPPVADAPRPTAETHENPICPDGGGTSLQMAGLIQGGASGMIERKDWQIMDAIMFKSCGSLYAVEKQTGIHRQEVKRRLGKLGLVIDSP